MQRIEKYGVIALVFLLVTILAGVAVEPEEGKSPFGNWFGKKDAPAEVAKLPEAPLNNPRPQGQPPLNNNPMPDGGYRPLPVNEQPFAPGSADLQFGADRNAAAPGAGGNAVLPNNYNDVQPPIDPSTKTGSGQAYVPRRPRRRSSTRPSRRRRPPQERVRTSSSPARRWARSLRASWAASAAGPRSRASTTASIPRRCAPG
jgi:hypothetical protein